MAGDSDRTSCDFCSRTCPGRHSEEQLHSNEEGCGGLPHLGGDSQPGQDHDDHDDGDHDDHDHDDHGMLPHLGGDSQPGQGDRGKSQ